MLRRAGSPHRAKSIGGSRFTDFRGTLAYAVSDLGGAIARLGPRIHRDAPGDYGRGFADGQQRAALVAAVGGVVTREDVRAHFKLFGLPSDDATLAKLGWPEERVDLGGVEEDNE